jgi:hypothetical protein
MQGIGWRSQIVEEGWDLWRIPLLWRPDTKQCLFRLPIATKFLFNNGERLLYSRLGLSYLPQSHLTAYSKEYFLYCTAKSYDLGYPIDCSRSLSLSLSLSLHSPIPRIAGHPPPLYRSIPVREANTPSLLTLSSFFSLIQIGYFARVINNVHTFIIYTMRA